MMNASLKAILVTTAACLSLGAYAADETITSPTPPLTKQEARDLKTQSNAEYKARKDITEAQKELEVADCKTALDGKDERDCKHNAKEAAKESKRTAKDIYKQEKADIKSQTN